MIYGTVLLIGAADYKLNFPNLFIDDRLVLGCMCIIASLSGLLAVIRKESPLYMSYLRGVQAVIIGYCWIIITWSFSIIFFAATILKVK